MGTTPRDLLRMSDDEVDTYLRAGSVCRIATVDATGAPHVVPVAFVLLDGAVTFWSDPASQKVVNVRRDPRVACVVDGGSEMADLRGVEVRGEARVVDDPALSVRVADLFAERVPEAFREAARAGLHELAAQRVVVVLTPTAIASWDHRKLAGVRPADIGH